MGKNCGDSVEWERHQQTDDVGKRVTWRRVSEWKSFGEYAGKGFWKSEGTKCGEVFKVSDEKSCR